MTGRALTQKSMLYKLEIMVLAYLMSNATDNIDFDVKKSTKCFCYRLAAFEIHFSVAVAA